MNTPDMPDPMKHACQALVVRYAADPARGELLNIGVVVLSPAHGFMGSRFLDNWTRVINAFRGADEAHLRRVAAAIHRSCETMQPTPLDLVVAFDAALPHDDASIVRSQTISGITADPERTLNELFERYVAARDLEEHAPPPSDITNLVLSAARYVQALAVLPIDPEYEARVDRLLAMRVPGTRKKTNVRRVR